ncbi:hypothetical protein [Sulfoacidibacillus thermotolerans]|uniref:Uncharacterized protein n=1 Tax=Sulfoacidibacillus thermotolerans TaxID=1765684 RepID=A0A2U3D9J0_SULT2|nr:hypothetical protein [Sulfoacidibacillus thermotolerans]PWI57944.1 hypothetical protein BM613_05915 [Sulfoacidibacillus thermotolerans]
MWKRIDELAVRDLAIVGVSKHAGKTTALNRLIQDAALTKRRLAIASIGIDGERADHVLGTVKPEIWVPAHTLFATAGSVMSTASAAVEWKVPTGIYSPLGEVWIGETITQGTICLAGVRQLAHLLTVKEIFRKFAVDHILFDGALSRLIATHPLVSDGVIVSTGAVVGPLSEVVKVTQGILRKLNLPAFPDPFLRELPIDDAGVFVGKMFPRVDHADHFSEFELGEIEHYPNASAFTVDIRGQVALTEEHRLFIYGGAVTDGVLRGLQSRKAPVFVVAATPAHVFVSDLAWRSFTRAGHHLFVRFATRVIGVTVNPTSPKGTMIDREQLLRGIESLTDVPVWDVME